MIDWAAFTPWTAAAGGALIGVAAVLLMLGAGRIAGISGILGGLLCYPVATLLLGKEAALCGSFKNSVGERKTETRKTQMSSRNGTHF